MATRRIDNAAPPKTRRPPATTPQARENQVIADAMALAEKQIHDGTASSQIISHFLKMGSSREQLEQERLRHENELTKVKIEAMESAKRVEEMYASALVAMREYSGQDPLEIAEEYDD